MLTIVGKAFSDDGVTMYACVFEDAGGFKAYSTAKALPPPQQFETDGEHCCCIGGSRCVPQGCCSELCDFRL